MERTIIIHKTAEEQPPKSGRFIVGRKENGQNFAMPCRYSNCQEGWNVGEHYWNRTDLAKLWPFWMDIPDFDDTLTEEKQPFTLKGFPEDQELPEKFTAEDLIEWKYRTDVQRILRRIVMEFGTEADGKLLYPLTKKEPNTNVPILDQATHFLAIVIDRTRNLYKDFIPNQVVICETYSIGKEKHNLCYDLPTGNHRKTKQISSEIKETIQRIESNYPLIKEKHNNDPEPGYGAKLISPYELKHLGWISTRCEQSLIANGIMQIGKIFDAKMSDIKKFSNVGKKTFMEILSLCDRLGITLKP